MDEHDTFEGSWGYGSKQEASKGVKGNDDDDDDLYEIGRL